MKVFQVVLRLEGRQFGDLDMHLMHGLAGLIIRSIPMGRLAMKKVSNATRDFLEGACP